MEATTDVGIGTDTTDGSNNVAAVTPTTNDDVSATVTEELHSKCNKQQPHWHPPKPITMTFPPTGLHMYNSLTRQKELFITMDGTKHLTWYM
jgi:hypothetical protein